MPGIGDAVLYLDALYNFTKYVNSSTGYNVYLAGNKFTLDFLKNISSTFNMDLIEIDLASDDRYTLKGFSENFKKLNFCNWDLVISFDPITPYVNKLLVGLECRMIFLPLYRNFNRKKFKDIIYNKLLTNFLEIEVEYTHLLSIHKKVVISVLNELFNYNGKDYSTYTIPEIHLNRYSLDSNFCVFSAGIAKGHANQYRCWGLKNFVSVIDYVVKNTSMTVLLCGDTNEMHNNNLIYEMVEDKTRIIDVTGKTNFAEWVELLRNAQFVFGNDSGYIHLAVALKTKAFVISGFWNYGRFFPYQEVDDILCPVDIRVETPICALCNLHSDVSNERHNCEEMVKTLGIYKCVNDISCELAIDAIKLYLQKSKDVG